MPSQFQLSPPQRMFVEASTMLARLSFRRSQPEASKPLGFQPVPVARAKFQKRLARHSFPAPQEPISSWQCLAGPSCRKCRRISVRKIEDSRGLCRFGFPEFPPASFRPLLGMTSWKLPLLTTLLTSNFHLLSFRPECFIISHFQGSKFQPESRNHHDCSVEGPRGQWRLGVSL